MNKLLKSAFVVLLVSSGQPLLALAAESDASNIGNANSPQQVDQANVRQNMHKKKGRGKYAHQHCDMHKKITDMDTNKDSIISKEEFMIFHEKMFDSMKQTDGMVSVKALERHMHDGMKYEHKRRNPESHDMDSHHSEESKT